MSKHDPLAEALGGLPFETLRGAVGDRVRKLAATELVPAPDERAAAPLRLMLTGALVPSLLISAAAVRAVETVKVAKQVFASGHAADGEHGERGDNAQG